MEKCIIVAVADNLAIGKDNAMLWHIAEDMKFFRRTTTGSPVIMGRRTFESIGMVLPKRLNIVVSRTMTNAPEGVVAVSSIEEALRVAEDSGAQKCFITGGAQVYRQAMDLSDTLILTYVHTAIEDADAFFPPIDPLVWEETERTETAVDPETGFSFEFATCRRRKTNLHEWKEKTLEADSGH